MKPNARQVARIRRLAQEAGSAADLVSWVRHVFAAPRGRPRGSSRYKDLDDILLRAIRAASIVSGAPMDELIRVNVQLITGPASKRATAQRLRKKARQLK